MLKTKKQRKQFIKNVIKFSIVSVVLIAVGVFATPKALDVMGYGPKPLEFKFESSLAPGWVSEGNVNPREVMKGQYDKDQLKQLPVASISVLQKESEASNNCFAAFSYYDTLVDTDELLKNLEEQTAADESLTVVKLDSYRSKIDTPEGSREYVLHQFDLQGAEGEKMLRGAAQGYIELKDSYIEIRAYCDQAEHLSALTLPLGIGAVKLIDQN